MAKKLYRSKTNSMIAGVCGGLAEYFDIDPTIVRLVAVLLILAQGVGAIGYIIAWIIVPQRKEGEEAEAAEVKVEGTTPSQTDTRLLPGLILIVVGIVFLLNNFVAWFSFGILWPLVLVVLGIYILIR
ncbi:MAG: hypothetical protein AMJ90_07645 [candidate division Zixibacteria bacterium SM23_73_2]|nr:MAG: hypothetical protein AMJ90_07645 [candidate division Zixibacteria bacterium SM23_73_2]